MLILLRLTLSNHYWPIAFSVCLSVCLSVARAVYAVGVFVATVWLMCAIIKLLQPVADIVNDCTVAAGKFVKISVLTTFHSCDLCLYY